MKFTINGFSQKKLIEFDLDTVDALILRYFVDFKDSGDMIIEIINNKPYYWIKYDKLIEAIPIIKISSKIVLRRRLKKMENAGILVHYQKKEGGNYSFYGLGPKYKCLIKTDQIQDINLDSEVQLKSLKGTTQKFKGLNSKVSTLATQKFKQNINLLKDKSIKYIYCSVVSYLNSKIGSKYKPSSGETQRFIHARLEEGFTLEDFKMVIDKKVKEWTGTSMEKYLRPSTLFGTKFESYLNQTDTSSIEVNKSADKTYEDFDFEFMNGGVSNGKTTTT